MTETADILILGGGLTGLAAASLLGDRAILLERESNPGGLVTTLCFDGYWFDRVVHLLYFHDSDTRMRIRALLGSILAPTPAKAWVNTAGGTVPYPLQMNLGGLRRDCLVTCLRDLAKVSFETNSVPARNYRQMLQRQFGDSLCELFFWPYNRKMWRRDLEGLAPSGFQWNIARPDFERVLRSTLGASGTEEAYNAKGFYPRPPANSPVRGMEVLSRALAAEVSDLRTDHTVEAIDVERREVIAHHAGERLRIRYRRFCLCTLPLPVAIAMSVNAPEKLRGARRSLRHNRVVQIGFCLQGPRPVDVGLWQYHADESLIFTRSVFMHSFDPLMAPEDGWSIMVEVPQRAECPTSDLEELKRRAERDLVSTGLLENCQIIGVHAWVVDPAYVVFTTENGPLMESCRDFLRCHDITPLGRYGYWEYSSMAQVMRDGFNWAKAIIEESRASRWK